MRLQPATPTRASSAHLGARPSPTLANPILQSADQAANLRLAPLPAPIAKLFLGGTVSPSDRPQLEAILEALIACLDDLDGDPDLEHDSDVEPDSDSEPSIGGGAYGIAVDVELDTSDAEPSIGWSEAESLIGEISCGPFDVDLEGSLAGRGAAI